MNKTELIKTIANKSGLSQKACGDFLDTFTSVVTNALVDHEKVFIMGFGSFETKKRAARIGRNPTTKEAIHIPEGYVPLFKPSQALKDSVKKLTRPAKARRVLI